MRVRSLFWLLLLATAGFAKPNHLVNEKSLYLKQHVDNPVDWYPWGEAAFAKAKAEDKPIFLSIGYSTCHWCHVMERETFTNPLAAAVLNENFVCIKVDREERPDVDQIYMAAYTASGDGGGWPLNMVLTPEREPFFGATYLPPAGKNGQPGFIDIMHELASSWKHDRAGTIARAKALTATLKQPSAENGTVERSLLFRYLQEITAVYEPHHGGFNVAPKFPTSMHISLLLSIWYQSTEESAWRMAIKTLQEMANGGIYDQLGGGFHRYSTDVYWLVPHFEKMLYDNALLARVYLDAFTASKDQQFARIARETLDYLLRDMHDATGGFYAATDADSEGVEGRFFVWTPAQVNALAPSGAHVFCEYYGVTEKGNFTGGTSILHVSNPLDVVSKRLKMSEKDVEAALTNARKSLLLARDKRVHPARDEKIITSWNALAITAFARGYQVFGDERYKSAAVEAGEFIFQHLVDKDQVYRRYAGGSREHPGTLEDYAYLADACIDLYETTFDPVWLTRARALLDAAEKRFADPAGSGAYVYAQPRDDLLAPMKEAYDGALPSGNSAAVVALARLAELTGVDALHERGLRIANAFALTLARAPANFPWMLAGVSRLTGSGYEIVLAGDPDQPDLKRLRQAVYEHYCPDRVIALAGGKDKDVAARIIPLLEGRGPLDGHAAAYVCRNKTCRRPTTNVEELLKDIEPAAARLLGRQPGTK